MDDQPVVEVRGPDGETMTLTYSNTTVLMFGGDDLDHVQVKVGDGVLCLFGDKNLIRQLTQLRFPVYIRVDQPEWAMERYIRAVFGDMNDINFIDDGE